jgi:hypothetical protein
VSDSDASGGAIATNSSLVGSYRSIINVLFEDNKAEMSIEGDDYVDLTSHPDFMYNEKFSFENSIAKDNDNKIKTEHIIYFSAYYSGDNSGDYSCLITGHPCEFEFYVGQDEHNGGLEDGCGSISRPCKTILKVLEITSGIIKINVLGDEYSEYGERKYVVNGRKVTIVGYPEIKSKFAVIYLNIESVNKYLYSNVESSNKFLYYVCNGGILEIEKLKLSFGNSNSSNSAWIGISLLSVGESGKLYLTDVVFNSSFILSSPFISLSGNEFVLEISDSKTEGQISSSSAFITTVDNQDPTFTGKVSIDNSEFSNIISTGVYGANISLKGEYELTLFNDIFINITNDGRTIDGGVINYESNISKPICISNCYFENCSANGLDLVQGGALYLSSSKGNIVLNFNNFINCVSSDKAGAVFLIIPTSLFPLLTINITDCNFQNCISEGSTGGVYVGGYGKVNIDGCSFTGCISHGEGGGGIGIFVHNEVCIKCSDLTECDVLSNGAKGGGGIYILHMTRLEIFGLSFSSCISTGTNSRGGGIYVDVTDNNYTDISYSKFSDCNCTGRGGGIYVGSSYCYVQGCVFSKCYSTGGALAFDDVTPLLLKYLEFTGNNNGTSVTAKDIYVEKDGNDLVYELIVFDVCSDHYDEPEIDEEDFKCEIMYAGENWINCSLFNENDCFSDFSSVIHVDGKNGNDIDTCGEELFPCKSLDFVFIVRVHNNAEIYFNPFIYTSHHYTVGDGELLLMGKTNYPLDYFDIIISASGSMRNSLYNVNNGKLVLKFVEFHVKSVGDANGNGGSFIVTGKDGSITLSNVSVKVNSANVKIIGSVIYATQGFITVIECQFIDINFKFGSVITLKPGKDENVNITIQNSKFEQIYSEMNGAAIHVSGITPSNEEEYNWSLVSIDNSNFTKCKTEGKGGALYLGGYYMSNIMGKFTECYGEEGGGAIDFNSDKRKRVLLNCYFENNRIADKENCNGIDIYDEVSGTENLNDDKNIIGCISTSTITKYKNPKYLFVANDSTIFDCLLKSDNEGCLINPISVDGNNGRDYKYCGSSEGMSCQTLDQAVSISPRNEFRKIKILNTAIYEEAGLIIVRKNLEIEGTDGSDKSDESDESSLFSSHLAQINYGCVIDITNDINCENRNGIGIWESSTVIMRYLKFVFAVSTFPIDFQGFLTINDATSSLSIYSCEIGTSDNNIILEPEANNINQRIYFIQVSGGVLLIDDLKINNIRSRNTHLIYYDDSSESGSSVTIKNVKQNENEGDIGNSKSEMSNNVITRFSQINALSNNFKKTGVLFGASNFQEETETEDNDETDETPIHNELRISIENVELKNITTKGEDGVESLKYGIFYLVSKNAYSEINLNKIDVKLPYLGDSFIYSTLKGGVVYFEGWANNVVISNSVFENIHAVDGGCLYFEFDISDSLTSVNISSVVFRNCSASNEGGSIWTNYLFYIEYSEFISSYGKIETNDDGSVIYYGHDIYYSKISNNDFMSDNILETCSFAIPPHPPQSKFVIGSSNSNVYYTFLEKDCIEKEFYVKNEGNDLNVCNTTNKPCKTLGGVKTTALNAELKAFKVAVLGNNWNVAKYDVDDHCILIHPYDASTIIPYLFTNSIGYYTLSVGSGILCFEDLKLYISTDLNTVFVLLNGSGDVRISNCLITTQLPGLYNIVKFPFIEINSTDGKGRVTFNKNTIISDIMISNSAIIRFVNGGRLLFDNIMVRNVNSSGSTTRPLIVDCLFNIDGTSVSVPNCYIEISITSSIFTLLELSSSSSISTGGVIGINGLNEETTKGSVVRLKEVDVNYINVNNIDGGFIYVNNISKLEIIEKSSFSNIKCGTRGGAIHILRSPFISIENSIFKYCECTTLGGAAYFGTNTNFTLKSVTFAFCGSHEYGGAICVYSDGSKIFEDCIFGYFLNENGVNSGPNIAYKKGNDICDLYSSADKYSNMVNCRSNSNNIKFWLNVSGFVLDCLLPSTTYDGDVCGGGITSVDNLNGENHYYCGDVQPCKDVEFAINVCRSGGTIELLTGIHEVTSTRITDKSISIKPSSDTSAVIITSLFDSIDQTILHLNGGSVTISLIRIEYHLKGFSYYIGSFFKTSNPSSYLIIQNCTLSINSSSVIIENSFVENIDGNVEIINCIVVGIKQISTKPLFYYEINNGNSLFKINNLEIDGSQNTQIEVDNLKSGIVQVEIKGLNCHGELYLFNSLVKNVISSCGGDVLCSNGIILSVSQVSNNLELIILDLRNNTFENISTINGNGGALAINTSYSNVESGYHYIIYNTSFILCEAENGGAVYINGSLVEFHLCIFINNSAFSSGNDIYFASPYYQLNYSNEINFIQNCHNHSITLISSIHFYLYGFNPNNNASTLFTQSCTYNPSLYTFEISSSGGSCDYCYNIFTAFNHYSNQGPKFNITSDINDVQEVNIDDNSLIVEGVYNFIYSQIPWKLYSPSTGSYYFRTNIGLLRIENLNLVLENNTVYFKLIGSGGIRIVNCLISQFTDASEKSFIEAESNGALAYLRDCKFTELNYTKVPSITYTNGHIISLVNVSCDFTTKKSYSTTDSPYFLKADPQSNLLFMLEIEDCRFSNIYFTHSLTSSKGFIYVSSSTDISIGNVFIINTIFEGVSTDSNVGYGGIIQVEKLERLEIIKSSFNMSGGGNKGGVIHVQEIKTLLINESTFNHDFASGSQPLGGVIYGIIDSSTELYSIYNSKFEYCQAINGNGGAIYFEFITIVESDGDSHPDEFKYMFKNISFSSNNANYGGHIFFEGYLINKLVGDGEYFDFDKSGHTLFDYFALEHSTNKGDELVELAVLEGFEYWSTDEANVVYVATSDELLCKKYENLNSEQNESCSSLQDALKEGSADKLTNIRVIDYLELKEMVSVTENVFIIGSAYVDSFVIVTIHKNGVIYLTPAIIKIRNENYLWNEDMSNLSIIFIYTHFEFDQDPFDVEHPFIVIEIGCLKFENCTFGRENGKVINENKISSMIYIADVYNEGELIFEGGCLSFIYFQSVCIIHAYDNAHISFTVFILFFLFIRTFF